MGEVAACGRAVWCVIWLAICLLFAAGVAAQESKPPARACDDHTSKCTCADILAWKSWQEVQRSSEFLFEAPQHARPDTLWSRLNEPAIQKFCQRLRDGGVQIGVAKSESLGSSGNEDQSSVGPATRKVELHETDAGALQINFQNQRLPPGAIEELVTLEDPIRSYASPGIIFENFIVESTRQRPAIKFLGASIRTRFLLKNGKIGFVDALGRCDPAGFSKGRAIEFNSVFVAKPFAIESQLNHILKVTGVVCGRIEVTNSHLDGGFNLLGPGIFKLRGQINGLDRRMKSGKLLIHRSHFDQQLKIRSVEFIGKKNFESVQFRRSQFTFVTFDNVSSNLEIDIKFSKFQFFDILNGYLKNRFFFLQNRVGRDDKPGAFRIQATKALLDPGSPVVTTDKYGKGAGWIIDHSKIFGKLDVSIGEIQSSQFNFQISDSAVFGPARLVVPDDAIFNQISIVRSDFPKSLELRLGQYTDYACYDDGTNQPDSFYDLVPLDFGYSGLTQVFVESAWPMVWKPMKQPGGSGFQGDKVVCVTIEAGTGLSARPTLPVDGWWQARRQSLEIADRKAAALIDMSGTTVNTLVWGLPFITDWHEEIYPRPDEIFPWIEHVPNFGRWLVKQPPRVASDTWGRDASGAPRSAAGFGLADAAYARAQDQTITVAQQQSSGDRSTATHELFMRWIEPQKDRPPSSLTKIADFLKRDGRIEDSREVMFQARMLIFGVPDWLSGVLYTLSPTFTIGKILDWVSVITGAYPDYAITWFVYVWAFCTFWYWIYSFQYKLETGTDDPAPPAAAGSGFSEVLNTEEFRFEEPKQDEGASVPAAKKLSKIPGFAAKDENSPDRFSIAMYSFDAMVPFINLHLYDKYDPVGKMTGYVAMGQHLVGRVLVTLLLATVTARLSGAL